MRKRKKTDHLFTAIIAAALMLAIYYLANLVTFSAPATLTIRYFAYLAIALIGLIALFRELSIWEISTHRLTIYEFGAIPCGFSFSKAMLTVAWCAALLFLILFVLSFFPFFVGWIRKLLGGPIILWLTMLASFLIMACLALSGHIFWEKISHKTRD